MLEHIKQRAMEIVDSDSTVISELLSSVGKFLAGKISREEWLAMDGPTRSTLAGAIAGNFAMHHPHECFEVLQSLKSQKI